MDGTTTAPSDYVGSGTSNQAYQDRIDDLTDELAAARAEGQSDLPRDGATGKAIATKPPGVTLDLTVSNDNDNAGTAGGGWPYGGGGYWADGGVWVGGGGPSTVAPPSSTTAPTATEAPVSQPFVCPPANCPASQRCGLEGMSSKSPGTFFCMTKNTFVAVIIMLIIASALVAVGFWIWRKKSMGGPGNAPIGGGGGPGGPGFDDLGGDLNFGGPPR